jgi:hypothetical protein
MSEINAIATNNYLLATQQEVSHDNTLSGNGTVDSPLGVVPGYNETVLYDNINGTNSGCILSEPITNFSRIEISYGNGNGRQIMQVDPRLCSGGSNVALTIIPTFNNGYASIYTQSWRFSSTTAFVSGFKAKEWWGNAAAVSSRDSNNLYVYGLTGINRKA